MSDDPKAVEYLDDVGADRAALESAGVANVSVSRPLRLQRFSYSRPHPEPLEYVLEWHLNDGRSGTVTAPSEAEVWRIFQDTVIRP